MSKIVLDLATGARTVEPYTPDELADLAARQPEIQAEATARQAAQARLADIAQAKSDAKADAFVQQFVAMTPAQVIAYVNANVNTLADAKQLLTKMALMLLAIAKEQYK